MFPQPMRRLGATFSNATLALPLTGFALLLNSCSSPRSKVRPAGTPLKWLLRRLRLACLPTRVRSARWLDAAEARSKARFCDRRSPWLTIRGRHDQPRDGDADGNAR